MHLGINDNRQEDDALENGKKIDNYYYNFNDVIGKGNFSQVFRGVDHTTNKYVAIKVVNFSSFTSTVAEQLLKNEVNILKELDHENVVKCLDVFKSKNNCYIVTELYQGGDLQKLIEKNKFLHQKNIGRIIYDIYKGLLYLNENNIVHRDLKPANIFLTTNGIPKIADFGFSIKSSQAFKDINIGSPIYMSPEALLKRQYGPKTQVWAFGILIYQALHGQTPLSYCRDQAQLKQKVLHPPTFRQGISPQLRNLIQLCLTVNSKQRIDIKQIANTSYMKRLIYEFEASKSKDLASTSHTRNSSPAHNYCQQYTQQVKTYQDGLALLQYCRLIHKTSQQIASPIFSQWLLHMSWSLHNIKIQNGIKQQNQNLLTTIHSYYLKYSQQHKACGVAITPYDVILQCQKLLQKIQTSFNSSSLKIKLNHLTILLRQTQMLDKCSTSHKLAAYKKSTQVQKYLDSLKYSKNSHVPPTNFSI